LNSSYSSFLEISNVGSTAILLVFEIGLFVTLFPGVLITLDLFYENAVNHLSLGVVGLIKLFKSSSSKFSCQDKLAYLSFSFSIYSLYICYYSS